MAYLQPNSPNILKGLHRDFSWKCRGISHKYIGLVKGRRKWENSDQKVRISSWTRREKGLVHVLKCCATSTSTTSSPAEEVEVEESTKYVNSRTDPFGFVLSTEHGWKVRRMVEIEEEMRTVARVQAEAFHEPVVFFNDLFFEFFQAEVLSGLLYKLRNSGPDRYACLVAEPLSDASDTKTKDLVGVVDVTVLRDADVLRYLTGVDEYLYVSGIAVLGKFRRQKVATALLKACDMLAMLWGFDYLVLRAYEDDWGARKLYTNAGYRVVSGDPVWITTLIGRRRRIVMIKRCKNT